MKWLERHLIFLPERYPAGLYQEARRLVPGEGGFAPAIEDCSFRTRDGLTLHGWWCAPRTRTEGIVTEVATERVLLWFHGNAGNLSYRIDMIARLMALPVNVFIIDYRGYGKSEGRPSEEGLYRDARAAWAYLTAERGVAPDRIVVFGKSLGGVPACDLCLEVEPAGLIVQSSFTSVPDMAREVFPIVPRFLVRTRMASIEKVPRITCPKLFVHSPSDEVVPYRLGRALFEAAAEPKEFFEVPGAGHNETYLAGGRAYLEALRGFLERCIR